MTNPPDLAPSGQPWAYGIRTWNADGTSHGGFKWDLTPDACTEAPDWKPEAECGNGLHANRDGWGDWSLLNMSEAGKIVGIVRWDPAEAVAIDEAKDKARRMWVVMTTRTASLGAVMGFINTKFRERMAREIAAQGKKVKTATKDGQHASAAGDSGHASAAGYRGHASAASSYGHASAAGKYGIAAALGIEGKAQAAETGAIVLARWDIADGEYRLTRVFAGMVGQTYGPTTIKPATWYALGADGLPVEVTQ